MCARLTCQFDVRRVAQNRIGGAPWLPLVRLGDGYRYPARPGKSRSAPLRRQALWLLSGRALLHRLQQASGLGIRRPAADDRADYQVGAAPVWTLAPRVAIVTGACNLGVDRYHRLPG